MSFEINKIYCENNLETMARMPAGFLDLIVTSPPYNCGKDYATISDSLSHNKYWEFTENWLMAAFRSLGDGGRLAVNLAWWMGKKPRIDVPYEFKRIALDVGFLFLDKILWIKGSPSGVHVTGNGWGTYLSPSGPAIRCASEPILIFAKGRRGRGVISGAGRGACIRGDITKKEFHNWTIDTWFISGVSNKLHPAVFPYEIPKRLIKLYTYPGELVYDPFLGSGTTIKAARDLGRNWIGSEISSEYVDLASDRIAQAILF